MSPLEEYAGHFVSLNDEYTKVIKAGNKLAEAAHYVQSNYDGIHRLRLALAEWYKIRADENGRGCHYKKEEYGNNKSR